MVFKNLRLLTALLFLLSSVALAQKNTDFKSANPNAIATEIASRVKARFEGTKFFKESISKKNEFQYLADVKTSILIMRVDPETLDDILKDREFKNQHETETSSGGYDPELRASIESSIAGVDLEKKIKEEKKLKKLLPKYGTIEFHDFAADPNVNEETWNQSGEGLDVYGEIQIIFKDDVKKRTTFAAFDTGNSLGVDKDVDQTVQSLQQSKVVIDSEHISRDTYFETQIWGKLTLDDIEYILIPNGYFGSHIDIKDTLKSLKATGIPVYFEKRRKELTELEKKMTDFRVSSFRGKIALKSDESKRKTFMKSSCSSKLKNKE